MIYFKILIYIFAVIKTIITKRLVPIVVISTFWASPKVKNSTSRFLNLFFAFREKTHRISFSHENLIIINKNIMRFAITFYFVVSAQNIFLVYYNVLGMSKK